jgi:hypothetical protein
MSYLDKYGKKARRFQDGGAMPEGEMAPPQQAGPVPAEGQEGQEGQEEQILQLAEAAVAGDEQAAAQLGMMLAPMILQQMEAEMQAGAGAEAAAPAAPEPVFRKGGKFVGSIR